LDIRRILAVTAAFVVLAAATSPVNAQSRWSFEARAGAAFADGDFGGADLSTGLGFIVAGNYRVMPHLAVYGGWTWYRFAADDAVLGEDTDIEDTGYAFGLRFAPEYLPALRPWLQVGGVFDHAEMENGANLTGDSNHTLGWEVGAGLGIPIGNLTLTPGARYRSFSPEFEMAGLTATTDLAYFAIELGLLFGF
jgi:hypothetical protein